LEYPTYLESTVWTTQMPPRCTGTRSIPPPLLARSIALETCRLGFPRRCFPTLLPCLHGTPLAAHRPTRPLQRCLPAGPNDPEIRRLEMLPRPRTRSAEGGRTEASHQGRVERARAKVESRDRDRRRTFVKKMYMEWDKRIRQHMPTRSA
jgi:hypothetical protein